MTPATKKTAKKTNFRSSGKTSPGAGQIGAPEQSMMRALRAEHRHMGTVLDLFSDQLDALEAGEFVDSHVVYESMDYITNWPDRFHHPREDIIYARVAEISANAADEVNTLQRDHDATAKQGKALLKTITGWRENKVKSATVVKHGRAYISHIYEHMNVEEQLVFPHIEAQLTLEDWRELEQEDSLQAVSSPIFGMAVQREYRNLTRNLRRSVRRKVEEGVLVEWVSIEALFEAAEVLSFAYESARDSTGSHLRMAVRDSWEFVRTSPLQAPFKCAANNTKVTFKLISDMAQISSETLDDLQNVRRARRDRLKLLTGGVAKS